VAIQTDNPILGIMVLAIMLGVLWFVIESAARTAVDGANRRPVFRASLRPAGELTELALDNTGPSPAYDVEVRWRGDRGSEPLLRTPLLAQGETWRAPARASTIFAEAPSADASASGSPVLAWLQVRYRRDAPPTGAVLTATVPVLVPGRPEEATGDAR
jgi:hypothetical protein